MSDGRWWVLGALGALTAAGVAYRSRYGRRTLREVPWQPSRGRWWHRYGSMADRLSPVQRRLLFVARTYRHDPEVAIRAMDIVMGANSDSPMGSFRTGVKTLVDDVRDLEGNPQADLADYLTVMEEVIADNAYTIADEDLAGPSKYTLMVPWVAKLVNKAVKASRRGRLEPVDERNLHSYRRDDANELERDEQILLQYQDYLRDNLSHLADWYATIANEARRHNQPIPVDILPLTWEQAEALSDEWHQEQTRIRLQMHAVPADPAFDLPNGWTLQRLAAKPHFIGESAILGHCIGDGLLRTYGSGPRRGEPMLDAQGNYVYGSNHFWQQHQSESHAFFSVRGPEGVARWTIALRLPTANQPEPRIEQFKGRCDRLPGNRCASDPPDWYEDLGAHPPPCQHGGYGCNNRPATPEELAEDLWVVEEVIKRLFPRMPVGRALREATDMGTIRPIWEKEKRRKQMIGRLLATMQEQGASRQQIVARQQKLMGQSFEFVRKQYEPIAQQWLKKARAQAQRQGRVQIAQQQGW